MSDNEDAYQAWLAIGQNFELDRFKVTRLAFMAGRASLPTGDAGEPVAWASPIVWAHRQSEQIVKITRKAQPDYGFTQPLYTVTPPATDRMLDAADERRKRHD